MEKSMIRLMGSCVLALGLILATGTGKAQPPSCDDLADPATSCETELAALCDEVAGDRSLVKKVLGTADSIRGLDNKIAEGDKPEDVEAERSDALEKVDSFDCKVCCLGDDFSECDLDTCEAILGDKIDRCGPKDKLDAKLGLDPDDIIPEESSDLRVCIENL